MDDKEHKKFIQDIDSDINKLAQENAEMRAQLEQARKMKAQQHTNKSKGSKGSKGGLVR